MVLALELHRPGRSGALRATKAGALLVTLIHSWASAMSCAYGRRRTSSSKPFGSATLCWLLALVALCYSATFGGVSVGAAEPQSAASKGARRACPTLGWHIAESRNFRVLVYSVEPADARVCDRCEALRGQLIEKWLGADSRAQAEASSWSPKCDIILHTSSASYVKAVGPGGAATVASSLVDQDHGKINLRRIDVRGMDPDWQSAALPHEMTHVVLADRFAGQRLPRWADEGVAILADPDTKVQGHLRDLEQAVATRNAFRVVELFALEDYPPANRWAAFYGQSASLTQFLVSRSDSSEKFVDFVELAMHRGYDAALRDVYQIHDAAELERAWRAQLRASKAPVRATAATEADVMEGGAAQAGSTPVDATPSAVAKLAGKPQAPRPLGS